MASGISKSYWVVLGAALWGTAHFLRKSVVAEVHPVLLAFLTCTLLSLFFLPLIFTQHHSCIRAVREYPVLVITHSLCGTTLGMLLLIFAYSRIDLSITMILERSTPIFILVLSRVFLKEKLGARFYGLFVLCLTGSVLSVFHIKQGALETVDLTGVICVFSAALCFAIATLLAKTLMQSGFNAKQVAYLRFVIGAITLLPFTLVMIQNGTIDLPSGNALIIVGVAALLCTGPGFFLYYSGLRELPASLVGTLVLVSPLTAALLAICVLGETLSITQGVGAVLLIVGLLLLATARRDSRPHREPSNELPSSRN